MMGCGRNRRGGKKEAGERGDTHVDILCCCYVDATAARIHSGCHARRSEQQYDHKDTSAHPHMVLSDPIYLSLHSIPHTI
eukprot:899097-Rhodomonas_salina.2